MECLRPRWVVLVGKKGLVEGRVRAQPLYETMKETVAVCRRIRQMGRFYEFPAAGRRDNHQPGVWMALSQPRHTSEHAGQIPDPALPYEQQQRFPAYLDV